MKNAKKGLSEDPKKLLRAARGGDILATARLLSFVEDNLGVAIDFVASQKLSVHAATPIRLGITGPPGAGKSSLLNLIIKALRAQKLRVAVLAVDPSSPFSGGALLGDRVRMSEHANDSGVFIRSLGSRGGFGGLSAATGLMARILEICRFDVVLIETVGVGQTELEIMNLADATAVVLVPESGDVIQTMKAGILEIADCFVVNKADRPGAETLAHELRALVEQEGASARGIFLTSALKKEGVGPVVEEFLRLAPINQKDLIRRRRRMAGELRHLLLFRFEKNVSRALIGIKSNDAYVAFKKLSRLKF